MSSAFASSAGLLEPWQLPSSQSQGTMGLNPALLFPNSWDAASPLDEATLPTMSEGNANAVQIAMGLSGLLSTAVDASGMRRQPLPAWPHASMLLQEAARLKSSSDGQPLQSASRHTSSGNWHPLDDISQQTPSGGGQWPASIQALQSSSRLTSGGSGQLPQSQQSSFTRAESPPLGGGLLQRSWQGLPPQESSPDAFWPDAGTRADAQGPSSQWAQMSVVKSFPYDTLPLEKEEQVASELPLAWEAGLLAQSAPAKRQRSARAQLSNDWRDSITAGSPLQSGFQMPAYGTLAKDPATANLQGIGPFGASGHPHMWEEEAKGAALPAGQIGAAEGDMPVSGLPSAAAVEVSAPHLHAAKAGVPSSCMPEIVWHFLRS